MEFDKFISTTVAQQFPQFYQAEGSNFIAFVRAYYEWMEQEGYLTDASKSLYLYDDIDTTIDQFAANFKNQYLQNFPATTAINRNLLVKRIKDFYKSKGSSEGMKLLFRLLFNDDIQIYDPGNDILKASDGIWKVPTYIEVERNDRSRTFLNQQITGSKSGATAFVESVYSKLVNQRVIDVLTISNLSGHFLYGELVTNDGDLNNAPKVTGSLTTINITDGGANNKIGDLFYITASTNGKEGSAKVVATTDGTGRVTFKLIDGGSGYTNAASQVKISQKVLFVNNRITSNVTTDYTSFASLYQPLNSMIYTVSTPSNPTSNQLYLTQVTGYDGMNNVVGNGYIVSVSTSTNTAIINITNGVFSTATSIKTPGNTISFTGYTLANVTATGIITGSNTTAVGVHNVLNTFYGNGAFVASNNDTYRLTANVGAVSTGSGANFNIGSLTDTETLFLFTDFISGNNVNGIPYLNMVISGGNSNTGLLSGTGSITCNSATNVVTGSGTSFNSQLAVGFGLYTSANVYLGTVNSISSAISLTLSTVAQANLSLASFKYNTYQYGFPKNVAAGYNSIIADALASNTFTIGTIASLGAINPGSNYNATPFVAIRNDYIAGYNRTNLVLALSNKTGAFALNDQITQSYTTPTTTLAFNANSGPFVAGEGVTQSNGTSNSYATLLSINTTVMVLTDVSGTFRANSAGGQAIRGLSSANTANVTAVSSTTTTSLAKGKIVNIIDQNTIEIKRRTFNEFFQIGSVVTSTSGGTGNVVSVFQNSASLPMGFNANVTANVSIARGIATQLQIIDSGHGHQPDDILTLVNNANPFAISGTANVYYEGIGPGYWVDNRGKLNSDKYIIDDEYYQDYSYEIQGRLSLDKYSDILKKIAHVAGTKLFGKVLIGATNTMNFTPNPAVIQFSS